MDDDINVVGGVRGLMQRREETKKPRSISPTSKFTSKKPYELSIDSSDNIKRSVSPNIDEDSPKLGKSNLLKSSKLSSSLENFSQESSVKNMSAAVKK
jgi:hypothetical protein